MVNKRVMRSHIILLFCFALVRYASIGQPMYVEHACCSSITNDFGAGTPIQSLSNLPHDVKIVVDRILTDRIPPYFTGKIWFREGLSLDLKKFIARYNADLHNLAQVTHRWIIPAFDLRFAYIDTTIGVKAYNVEMRLDPFGQVLKLNLPHLDQYRSRKETDSVDRHGGHHIVYSPPERPYELCSLKSALDSATNWAKSRRIPTERYRVDLRYDDCLDALFWWIGFWQKSTYLENGLLEEWQTFEIDAQTLSLRTTYEDSGGFIE